MSDTDQAARIRHLEADNARLRQLLEQGGMSATLRHQVRNALGLMRAILRRSVEGKTNVEDFAAHVEGRFDALLRVQTALLSSPDTRADLATLIGDELLAQTISENDRASLSGPVVRLDARYAELFGLVVHELAVNALKFGALATPQGRIDVRWAIEASRTLTLTWTERGQRDVDPSPAVRGFGIDAIEGMLPYQLRAESRLQFLPGGLRWTVMVRLPTA